MAGNATEPGRSVTSKVVAILLTFRDGDEHSLTEIARLTCLPVSTTHRLVAELAGWGLLERTDESQFRVGGPMTAIGGRVSYSPRIIDSARRVLDDLVATVRTPARLGVLAGAVAGAVILAVVPYGPLLLLPCAVFAALLPFGRSRNYGLFSIFQTPLVVILIDLLARTGWPLAVTRLTDTLLGCGIVLLIGYAPWPMSWQAHLPGQFSTAVDNVARYAQSALGDGSPESSRLRRQAYCALSDLRTEFQRTMAEPHAVSGRAALWWPAIIALEHLMDKVTATAVQAGQGAARPSQDGVRQVTDALDAIARAARSGTRPPALPPPDEEPLLPVADAMRGVQHALTGAPSLAR